MITENYETEVVIIDADQGDIATREFYEGAVPEFKVNQIVVDNHNNYFRIKHISNTTHMLTKRKTIIFITGEYIPLENLPEQIIKHNDLDSGFAPDFGTTTGRAYFYNED